MCGIVGLVGKQGPDDLRMMSSGIENRGPDDYGEYRDRENQVAVAARRLSIVDIEGGHQPMTSEDGQLVIVYNGEIYNTADLRTELIQKGIRFKTSSSDTEVLLQLYKMYQSEMLSRLNGIFAFVIYDKTRKVLFGARDPMGVKPLFCMRKPNFFSFGSEIKCFLPISQFSNEIDNQALFDYTSLQYIPGEQTIYQNVKKIIPGHYFRYQIDTSEFTVKSYWDLDFQKSRTDLSISDWSDRIRSELKAAVKRQLLGEVPVACSLSGGIDSSSIVGLLSKLGYSPLSTYSLGFSGDGSQSINELELARKVAQKWGSQHHERILSPDEVLNDLVEMVWSLDEPYGGGLPSWYIYKMIGESQKVCFTGTGGDELFGNYGKFSHLERSVIGNAMLACPDFFKIVSKVTAPSSDALQSVLFAVPNTNFSAPIKNRMMNIFDFSNQAIGRYYFRNWYLWSDHLKKQYLFSWSDKNLRDTSTLIREIYDQAHADTYRDKLAYVDFKTQLPEEFLMVTDRFSMAHSVEARVPFLDVDFIKLIASIPSQIRTKPHNLKYLLKSATSDLLPQEVVNSPKKGFVLPTRFWLQNQLKPLVMWLLSSDRLRKQGIFNPDFFKVFVEPTIEGRADFSAQVWSLVMFQIWHVVFIERACKYKPTFNVKSLQS